MISSKAQDHQLPSPCLITAASRQGSVRAEPASSVGLALADTAGGSKRVNEVAAEVRLASTSHQNLQAMRELSGLGGVDRRSFAESELFTQVQIEPPSDSLNSKLLEALRREPDRHVADELGKHIVVRLAGRALSASALACDAMSYQSHLAEAWKAKVVPLCMCRRQGIELRLERDDAAGTYFLKPLPLNDHLLVCPFGRTLRNSRRKMRYVLTSTGVGIRLNSRLMPEEACTDHGKAQTDLLTMLKLQSELKAVVGERIMEVATQGMTVEKFWASGNSSYDMLRNLHNSLGPALEAYVDRMNAASSVASQYRSRYLVWLSKANLSTVAALLWAQAGLLKRKLSGGQARRKVFSDLAQAADEVHGISKSLSSVLYVVADPCLSNQRQAWAMRTEISHQIKMELVGMSPKSRDQLAARSRPGSSRSVEKSESRRRLLLARVDSICRYDSAYFLKSLGLSYPFKLGSDILEECLRHNDNALIREAIGASPYIPSQDHDPSEETRRVREYFAGEVTGQCDRLGFDIYILAQCTWARTGPRVEKLVFFTTTHDGFPIDRRADAKLLSRIGPERCIARALSDSCAGNDLGPLQLADCDTPTLLTHVSCAEKFVEDFPGFDLVRYDDGGHLVDSLPRISAQITRAH